MRSYPRAAAVSFLSVSKAAFSVLMFVNGIAASATPSTNNPIMARDTLNAHCRRTRLRLFVRYSFDRPTGSNAGSPTRFALVTFGPFGSRILRLPPLPPHAEFGAPLEKGGRPLMTLPLLCRRRQLPEFLDLFGVLVDPASQLVPLTDQAVVTHVDEFARTVGQRPAIEEANARVGKYRNHSFKLCYLAIGKSRESRGGRG